MTYRKINYPRSGAPITNINYTNSYPARAGVISKVSLTNEALRKIEKKTSRQSSFIKK